MNSDSMKEDLHVLVQCEDYEEVAKKKMKRAVEYIRYLLVPPVIIFPHILRVQYLM